MTLERIERALEQQGPLVDAIIDASRNLEGDERARAQDAYDRLDRATDALRVDVFAIRSVQPCEWPSLRARVEGDLDEHSGAAAEASEAAALRDLSLLPPR